MWGLTYKDVPEDQRAQRFSEGLTSSILMGSAFAATAAAVFKPRPPSVAGADPSMPGCPYMSDTKHRPYVRKNLTPAEQARFDIVKQKVLDLANAAKDANAAGNQVPVADLKKVFTDLGYPAENFLEPTDWAGYTNMLGWRRFLEELDATAAERGWDAATKKEAMHKWIMEDVHGRLMASSMGDSAQFDQSNNQVRVLRYRSVIDVTDSQISWHPMVNELKSFADAYFTKVANQVAVEELTHAAGYSIAPGKQAYVALFDETEQFSKWWVAKDGGEQYLAGIPERDRAKIYAYLELDIMILLKKVGFEMVEGVEGRGGKAGYLIRRAFTEHGIPY
jgi:hypothetical protein